MLTCSHVQTTTGSAWPEGLGRRARRPLASLPAPCPLLPFGVRSVVVACDDAGERRRERTAGMPVIPGAEPFFHSGGNTGVLLCHGFTGSPASLRPWADHLAAAGLTVSLPRLPGHGTTWQDMAHTRWEDWFAEVDRAYEELRGHADEIFLMGLSMGACLALRMAELRGDGVAGPVLVYLSTTDHVVGPGSMKVLRSALPAAQFTVRECADSYHVATLDNDAAEIFAGSLDFVRAHSRAGRE